MSAPRHTEPGRHNARPWYCSDKAIDEYRTTITHNERDLPMIKTLKVTRAIVVNIGVLAGWFYSLSLGADPTLISALALIVLGSYNGLEISDYLALLRAYQEVQSGASGDGSDSDGSE